MAHTREEENKSVVRRALEELTNKGNFAAAGEYLAAGYQRHEISELFPNVSGYGSLKGVVVALRGGMPDLHAEIHEMVAEGDRVVTRYTVSGTHTGELFGCAGTGRRLSIKGINIYRIADGKIAEWWQALDALGLLRQIGALPPAPTDEAS